MIKYQNLQGYLKLSFYYQAISNEQSSRLVPQSPPRCRTGRTRARPTTAGLVTPLRMHAPRGEMVW